MDYDKKLIAAKLRRWEGYLDAYHLPDWNEIPNIGLYMEQVLTFLGDYLDYLPPELKEDQFLTPSTINNYVRKNIMPEPIKKRYYRIHIAYLVIILTLKRSLPISLVSKIIPNGIPEDQVKEIYSSYVIRHSITESYFVDIIRDTASKFLDIPDVSTHSVDNANDLILTTAILSYYTRFLSEKLLLLEEPKNQQIGDYEKPPKSEIEDSKKKKHHRKKS